MQIDNLSERECQMNISQVIQSEKEKGGLLDVLKAVQREEGYLSEEAIRAVAAAYGRSPSEIFVICTLFTGQCKVQ